MGSKDQQHSLLLLMYFITLPPRGGIVCFCLTVCCCCCRDSGQPDVFFTLSYQSSCGPTSVRVQLNNLLFSLHGSQRTFTSLFKLLTYYTGSSCKLTVPYRRQRPERLKQMCRRALVRTFGAETISTLPRLSTQIKDYVHAYPHSI